MGGGAAAGVVGGFFQSLENARAENSNDWNSTLQQEKTEIKIGFHTDAFNSSYKRFEDCLKWAQKNGVHFIECGLIDGVSWIHGLGYQPHVALYEDPELLRRKMEELGIKESWKQEEPHERT